MTADASQYLAFIVGGQLCGLPVLEVREVLRSLPPLAAVPCAPRGVSGVTNLRGRIAAAVSLRECLGFAAAQEQGAEAVVIENKGELYCLAVDAVRGVLSFDAPLAPAPATLQGRWREVVTGVCRLENGLLAVLDAAGLIEGLGRNNEEENPQEG